MHPHNVRDRVLKRAFVGLIRNVTGTTGYFKAVADSDQERPASQVKRQCTEHKKTYTRREKDGRVWYSHKEGNGYCNADRKLVEQWEQRDSAPEEDDYQPEGMPAAPTGTKPDYTQFFDEAREIYGHKPEEALTILGAKDWNAWTKKGQTLDSAREKLSAYHAERASEGGAT